MSEAVELNTMAKYQLVWSALRELGIAAVSVNFSGEGDSGQIDDIDPTSGLEFSDNDSYVAAMKVFEEHNIIVDNQAEPLGLRALIEELSDDRLQHADIPDWYNNDGGNGSIKWHVGAASGDESIEITVNVAIVEYDTTVIECDRYGSAGEDATPEQDAA